MGLRLRCGPLLLDQTLVPKAAAAPPASIRVDVNMTLVPVTYVLFPDEGHGFARPENRLKFYAAAEAFLARHLGGGRWSAPRRMEGPHS